jgi:hypothetical protein
MLALPGLLMAVPVLGSLNTNLNSLVPENGLELPIGTETVRGVESFSAHFSVPLIAVKSIPDTAVPLVVV